MKRIIFVFAAAFLAAMSLVSCNKEEVAAEYTVSWEYNRNLEKLMIWECDDAGSKLMNHTRDNVRSGNRIKYTAIPEATKVKIYFKTEKNSWGVQSTYWVQQVFLLKKGENTLITITGDTIVGPDEP